MSWTSQAGYVYADDAYNAYNASPTVANGTAAIVEAQTNQQAASLQGDAPTMSDMANLIANIATQTPGAGAAAGGSVAAASGTTISPMVLGLAALAAWFLFFRSKR